jgi:hypothetical protein
LLKQGSLEELALAMKIEAIGRSLVDQFSWCKAYAE